MSLLFENYVIRVNLGQKLGLKKKSRRHGLLTKCEVKMAGYWPSFFFLRAYGPVANHGARFGSSCPFVELAI